MEIDNQWVKATETLLDQGPEMLALLERLCNQNSGTLNLEGIARVRDMLLEAFEPLGGTSSLRPVPPMESVNDRGEVVTQPLGDALLIEKRPDAATQLLLCIHMDTVYDLNHPFQKCVRLDENTLNGPGVIDAKGGLVVMLHALRVLEASSMAERVGWKVLINPDEELGSPGSNVLIRELAHQASWGLLFEPELPSGELVSWRKGSGSFTFVVRGRAAHAGREFHKGRNAVAAMSRLMVAIDELNEDPEVTFNVGRVSGGGALNIVPDLAVGRINVRVKTLEQQARVEQQLQELITTFQSQSDGIQVEMHGSFTSPPKMVSEGTQALMHRIERCGEALEMPVQWQGTGGASDGNKFAAEGLPNIDSLGPAGGDIHSSREFLKIDSLVPKARLAALVLLTLASEAPVPTGGHPATTKS